MVANKSDSLQTELVIIQSYRGLLDEFACFLERKKNESVAMEATPEECIQRAIEAWKHLHTNDSYHGLAGLLNIVRFIYKLDQIPPYLV